MTGPADHHERSWLVERWLFVLAALFGLVMPATFAGATPGERPRLPEPLGYVSDHAQVLDSDWRSRIRSVCQDLERKTGVEMVVVTVPSLKPFATPNLYSEALFQNWKIGSTAEEHGLLILLSVQERQAAITVGKRMVPTVTSAVVQKVWTEFLEPSVRTGHFGEGLYRTVVGIASVSQDIRVGPPARSHLKGLGFVITLATVLSVIGVLWWISRPDLRHPFSKIRKGDYWAGGQGGFGGNFGGFGGVMGGDGLS